MSKCVCVCVCVCVGDLVQELNLGILLLKEDPWYVQCDFWDLEVLAIIPLTVTQTKFWGLHGQFDRNIVEFHGNVQITVWYKFNMLIPQLPAAIDDQVMTLLKFRICNSLPAK